MNGYLLAGIVLVLGGLATGCGATLDVAIRSANLAGTTAIAAHDEIRVLCVAAEEHADTAEKADRVIKTCSDAENAYGAFRSSWLALAAAVRAAELSGTASDNLAELVAQVNQAAAAVMDAVARIKALS